MSDFEKWFKSLNKNGRVTYFLGQEGRISEEAWNHQQAIIDDLIHKAKLRESDHRALLVKYQATKKCWEDVSGKCEELKAQLNNMETCYIEKKKECEDQLNQTKDACGRYDRLYEEYRLLELLVGNYRVLAQEVLPRCSRELLENIEGWEKALRGES